MNSSMSNELRVLIIDSRIRTLTEKDVERNRKLINALIREKRKLLTKE